MMIDKSVVPAAGIGTRLMPFTKNKPKELLLVNNKPLIQYSIEESLSSGLKKICVVNREEKVALKRYLESIELDDLIIDVAIQSEPYGLGDAVSVSEDWIGSETFAVILPDDIVSGPVPCTERLTEVYNEYQCSVIGLESTVHVSKYGMIKGTKIDEDIYRLDYIVEKPPPALAPSDVAVIGRYILTPEIFSCIGKVKEKNSRNVELTDAIKVLLDREDVMGLMISGKRYDCGDIMGYRRALEELGHNDLRNGDLI